MKGFRKLVVVNVVVLLITILFLWGGYELYLRYQVDASVGPKAAVTIPIFEEDDQLTWWHRSDYSFDYLGGESYLNQFGHRDEYYPNAKSQLLLLGDSFIFGMNVPDDQTIASRLQAKMNNSKWDVQNAGVIGYTIDQQLLYLTEHVDELAPEAVVLTFFVANDITEQRRHKVERNEEGYPLKVMDQEVFVTNNGHLGSQNKVLFNSLALADVRKRWRSFMRQITPYAGLTWATFLAEDHVAYPGDINELWDNYESDLLLMKEFLAKKSIPLVVMVMPMDVQVDHKYWDKYPTRVFAEQEFEQKLPQQRINQFCEEYELTCLDLLPGFIENKEKQLYFAEVDPHLDKEGNQLAADLLFAKLKDVLTDF